jgi:hypothetical protein
MSDPRVRERLAPNPSVVNALAVLDDPRAALVQLRASARTGEPSATRDHLIAEFERLETATTRAESAPA